MQRGSPRPDIFEVDGAVAMMVHVVVRTVVARGFVKGIIIIIIIVQQLLPAVEKFRKSSRQ